MLVLGDKYDTPEIYEEGVDLLRRTFPTSAKIFKPGNAITERVSDITENGVRAIITCQ